jgi:hypothetical protein
LLATEQHSNGSQRPPARRKRSRSAVTSGRKLWVDGNPNSAWSRRYSDILNALIADLAGGACPEVLSQAQLSLCRRAAALTVECEQAEGRASQGEAMDLDAFGRAVSHLRRLLETLGIERRARDVVPSLSAYLESKQRKETTP